MACRGCKGATVTLSRREYQALEIAAKKGREAMAKLAEAKAVASRLPPATALLRRAVVELVYVNDGVENCSSGLCATGEGKECIRLAEAMLGPIRNWPEVQ